MKEFNVEHQYQLFLTRMALSEEMMHPAQRQQVREIFYGAFGQCLILLRDDLPLLEEKKGIQAYGDMINQVMNFFIPKQ